MPYNKFMRDAIAKYGSGGFGDICRATTSISSVESALASGSVRSRTALNIIDAAQQVGYSDIAAMHIAIVAAPESSFNPNAYAKSTRAAGYFQLTPKSFTTSGKTSSPSILRKQLTEIRTKYGDRVLEDLALLYATHFYVRLGIAYSSFKTLGLQPQRSTMNDQYVLQDAVGTSFHSPLLNALYAAEAFSSYTGVQIEISIPSVPSVVTQTTKTGKRQIASFILVAPFSTTSGSNFVVAPASGATSVDSIDTGNPISFGGMAHDFDEVDWRLTSKLMQFYVSEDQIPLRTVDRTLSVYGQFMDGEFPKAQLSVMSIPENAMAPAVDSIMSRIKDSSIDLEILKATFLSIAFEEQSMWQLVAGKLVPNTFLTAVLGRVQSDSSFRNIMLDLSSDEQNLVLQSLLAAHLSASSGSGLTTQLANHSAVMLHMDFSQEAVEYRPELARWDVPWLAYSGVLFPMSLLVTPSYGSGDTDAPKAIGSKFVLELLRWARNSTIDIGSTVIKNLTTKWGPPPDKSKTRK